MKHNLISDPKFRERMCAFTEGWAYGQQRAIEILEQNGLTESSLCLIKKDRADIMSDDGISGKTEAWPDYDTDAEVNLLGEKR